MSENPKRRYINFRTFLILFVVIITAIFCGYVAELNSAAGWLCFVAALIVFTVLILVSFAYLDKRFKIASVIIAAILFIISFLSIRIASENRFPDDLTEKTAYTIIGTVEDTYSRGESLTFVLKDISFNNQRYDGKLRVSVEMPVGDHIVYLIRTGDELSLKAKLYFVPLIVSGRVNSHTYMSDVRYTCYPDADSISAEPGQADALTRFSENVNNILVEAMGAKIGNLAFAMLVGDKSNITEETRDGFTISGLSHILAVSGIHIAYICLILNKIFEKLRLNKIIRFVITMSLLLFYMFLCNLSSPVIRSTIMYGIMLFSKLTFKRYDALSSLCLACCIILLIYPYYLFDAGFILSAAAVYALILFAKPCKNFFLRLRFPKRLASAFGTVTAVQLGILPAIFYFFAEFQTYAILANLLLMLLIFIVFIGLLIFIIFALISSRFYFLLSIIGIGLSVLDTAAYAISLLPYAAFIFPATGIIFTFYICCFFFSRFYMSKFKISPVKITSVLLGCVVLLSGVLIIEKPNLNNAIIPVSSYDKMTSIVIADKNTYIVGDFPTATELTNFMRLKFFNEIEAVILNHLYDDEAEEIARLMLKVNIKRIYVPFDADMSGLSVFMERRITNLELINKGEVICGRFSGVYSDGKTVGFMLETTQTNVMFVKKATYRSTDFQAAFDKCAIIRCFAFSSAYPERFYLYNYLVDEDTELSHNPNYIFKFDTGDYYLKKF